MGSLCTHAALPRAPLPAGATAVPHRQLVDTLPDAGVDAASPACPPPFACRQQDTFSICMGQPEVLVNDEGSRTFLALAACRPNAAGSSKGCTRGCAGSSCGTIGGGSEAAARAAADGRAGGPVVGGCAVLDPAGREAAPDAVQQREQREEEEEEEAKERQQQQQQQQYSPQLVSLCHAISSVFASHGLPRFHAVPRPHASGEPFLGCCRLPWLRGWRGAARQGPPWPACLPASSRFRSANCPPNEARFAKSPRCNFSGPSSWFLVRPCLQSPGYWVAKSSSCRQRWQRLRCGRRPSSWLSRAGSWHQRPSSARQGSGHTRSGRWQSMAAVVAPSRNSPPAY